MPTVKYSAALMISAIGFASFSAATVAKGRGDRTPADYAAAEKRLAETYSLDRVAKQRIEVRAEDLAGMATPLAQHVPIQACHYPEIVFVHPDLSLSIGCEPGNFGIGVALGCTDLRGVLDAVLARTDADGACVSVVARGSGGLAAVALFATALDQRIKSADLDFAHGCFERRDLPQVANLLRYGDVYQWAAISADRKLMLHRVPVEADDPRWLEHVFAAAQNAHDLRIDQ